MCPYTAEDIGNDDYDTVLVEAETIGGPVHLINPSEVIAWYEEDEGPVSVQISIPPNPPFEERWEERSVQWNAEDRPLFGLPFVHLYLEKGVDSRLLGYANDVQFGCLFEGSEDLVEENIGDRRHSFLDFYNERELGWRDYYWIGTSNPQRPTSLAVAFSRDETSDEHPELPSRRDEVYPEIGLSTCSNWVLILQITQGVLIDSSNLILDVEINRRVCRFENGTIASPVFFVRWFARNFHLAIRIDDSSWGELVTCWFEMSEMMKPTIVAVPIPERLWIQMVRPEIFKVICEILLDEGVRRGDWVTFTEIPSGHSAGCGQT